MMERRSDQLQWVAHMRDVDRTEWTRLADEYDSPLLDWDWLQVLEESGSVSPESGWLPNHLLLRRDGQLVCAAPLYVRTHSAGEFVFDYAWADVAEQLRIPYYPKLVAMSPLTPAVGYRFLIAHTEDPREVARVMVAEIHRFCAENSIHGFSILWPEPDFAEYLDAGTFIRWRHQHFRLDSSGLRTFDDYLGQFTKNQRRNIRRERSSMEDQGIRVAAVPGAEAPRSFYRLMFEYYSATNDQFGMWAARYLTEAFFHMLPDACPDRVLFTAGWERGSDDPVGMAMLLHKPGRLIGRYWGERRFVNNLHFNLCYYVPIDWALRNEVREFDPGMGSAHKIRRGFHAIATDSLHHFYDTRMHLVMQMNIDKINTYEQKHIDQLNAAMPIARRTPGQ